MGESHTRGPQLHRPVVPESTGGQSAMTRVSYGRPFKPYVYGGGEKEPPAVIAARERYRALSEEIGRRNERLARALALREESMPDTGPGPEWYREMADE